VDRPVPLGVFDSGVGGLTVLSALRRALPHTDFVYVADTARVPYGRKPKEMVREFAREITDFLVELGVRGIVVACNTASAAALPALWESSPVPVWGVIDPGVEAACRQTRSGRVGVIGTVGTIRSGVYQQKLGPDIDTLVLGCTHYPVLRDVIQRAVGDSVKLVSSAEVTAERLAGAFGANGSPESSPRVTHYVTGDVSAYRHTAAFMGGLDDCEIHHLDVNELAS
jgi:glutamate racemase